MQNKETKKIALVPRQKSFWLLIIVTIILSSVIVAGVFVLYKNSTTIKYENVLIGGSEYKLEIADSDALRKKGLSERDSIPNNSGMLFDFAQEGDWRMWMVQMRFPIDIIWLNKDKKIVHIKNNATPAEYPDTYRSPELSRFVIELPTDAVEKLKIKVGDTLSFNTGLVKNP